MRGAQVKCSITPSRSASWYVLSLSAGNFRRKRSVSCGVALSACRNRCRAYARIAASPRICLLKKVARRARKVDWLLVRFSSRRGAIAFLNARAAWTMASPSSVPHVRGSYSIPIASVKASTSRLNASSCVIPAALVLRHSAQVP